MTKLAENVHFVHQSVAPLSQVVHGELLLIDHFQSEALTGLFMNREVNCGERAAKSGNQKDIEMRRRKWRVTFQADPRRNTWTGGRPLQTHHLLSFEDLERRRKCCLLAERNEKEPRKTNEKEVHRDSRP